MCFKVGAWYTTTFVSHLFQLTANINIYTKCIRKKKFVLIEKTHFQHLNHPIFFKGPQFP